MIYLISVPSRDGGDILNKLLSVNNWKTTGNISTIQSYCKLMVFIGVRDWHQQGRHFVMKNCVIMIN